MNVDVNGTNFTTSDEITLGANYHMELDVTSKTNVEEYSEVGEKIEIEIIIENTGMVTTEVIKVVDYDTDEEKFIKLTM